MSHALKVLPGTINQTAVAYFKGELVIASEEAHKPISTLGEIAELVESDTGLQATAHGITHGDNGLAASLYEAVLGIQQSQHLQEVGTDEVFSAEAQALYKAIIDNEWEPMLLKSPEAVAKLVEKDERLVPYKMGDEKRDRKLFDETFRYARFVAAENIMADPDNDNYQMRTNPLSKQELAEFRDEFLRRLDRDVKAKYLPYLDEKDIRKIVENNLVLRDLVKFLTDGNENLVENLYTETVAWIQTKHGLL